MDEEKMGRVSSGERPQRNRQKGRKGRCRGVVSVEEGKQGWRRRRNASEVEEKYDKGNRGEGRGTNEA